MSGLLNIPNVMPATDNNGDPVPGAKIYIYANRTTTPVTGYADVDLVTPLTWPVVADSSGRFPLIFLSTYDSAGAQLFYSVTVTKNDGTPIVSYDDVAPSLSVYYDSNGGLFINAAAFGTFSSSYTLGTVGIDCAPAIQAAIDAAWAAGGGTVVIPGYTVAPIWNRITPRHSVKVIAKGAYFYSKGPVSIGIATGDYLTDFEWDGGMFQYDGRFARTDKLFDLGSHNFCRIKCRTTLWYTGTLNHIKPAYTGFFPQNTVDNYYEIDGDYCRVGVWAEGLENTETEIACDGVKTSFVTTFTVNWPSSILVLRYNSDSGWYERLSYPADYSFSTASTSGGQQLPGFGTVVTSIAYPTGDHIKMYNHAANFPKGPISNCHYRDHIDYANVGWCGVRWHDAPFFEAGRYLSSVHQDKTGTLTGTVSFTLGGTAFTGSGTAFNTELALAATQHVGMRICYNGKEYKVASYPTATTGTITADFPFEETATNVTCTIRYVKIFGEYPTPTSVWFNAFSLRDAHVSIANFQGPILSPGYTVTDTTTVKAVRFGAGARNNTGDITVDFNYNSVGSWRQVTDGERVNLTGTVACSIGGSVLTGTSTLFTRELACINTQIDVVRMPFASGVLDYAVLWVTSATSVQLGTYAPKTATSITYAAGGTAIVGVGSSFLTDFAVNDIISDSANAGYYYKVATRADDTHMTITSVGPFPATFNSASMSTSTLIKWTASFPSALSGATAVRIARGDDVTYVLDITQDGDVAYSRSTRENYKAGNSIQFTAVIPAGFSQCTVNYPFIPHRTPLPHELIVQSSTVLPRGAKVYVPDTGIGSSNFILRYDGAPSPIATNVQCWLNLQDVDSTWVPTMTGVGTTLTKTGTIAYSSGGSTITGTSTAFLTDLSRDITIQDDKFPGIFYTIASITNDTTAAISGTFANASVTGSTIATAKLVTNPVAVLDGVHAINLSYTLTAQDVNKVIICTNAGTITVTIPLSPSPAMPAYCTIKVRAAAAGNVIIAATGGVTLTAGARVTSITTGLTTGQTAVLTLTGTNTWIIEDC